MRILLSCLLFAFAGTAWAQDAESSSHQAAREFFDNLAYLEGGWQLENFLMTGPGQSTTKEFSVTTTRVFDGLGLNSHWIDNETGDWIGNVITTFDPATHLYSVRFFDGRNNLWVDSDQTITLTESGFESTFSGEDQHGPFESRTRMERISDDHYRQTIERRYPGTDWFVTDSVEARRD
ncbi:MAG: DUF1579 domain-containing protein [Alphaproteobacteria bacterium]|nr:DUF1579 domain-containing protein [Alphaproteobacteria bacterium]